MKTIVSAPLTNGKHETCPLCEFDLIRRPSIILRNSVLARVGEKFDYQCLNCGYESDYITIKTIKNNKLKNIFEGIVFFVIVLLVITVIFWSGFNALQ